MPIRTDLRRPSRTITTPSRRFRQLDFAWELPTILSIAEGIMAVISIIILTVGFLTLCAIGAMVMPFIARLVWFTASKTPQMVTSAAEAPPENWFWFIVTAFMLICWAVIQQAAENEGETDEPIRGRKVRQPHPQQSLIRSPHRRTRRRRNRQGTIYKRTQDKANRRAPWYIGRRCGTFSRKKGSSLRRIARPTNGAISWSGTRTRCGPAISSR